MSLGVPDTIGDYKILDRIGHGGMGTLYRARDPRIGRDVAIKLLREGLDDPDMRERFAREARSAGRLKHGNIVTIFELGDHDGMPFIAMEYIQGETLAALLKQRPPVPIARKLQMMDQMCAGLHYAHRMGIVHRDIKPANIMIDDEGTIKILDFGIARMGASKVTQTGVVIGTLNYMSPEQMKGMPTDARADIFSLGAVFYELLSYRNAFAGDAPSTVMHRILYGRPEQLEIVCPTLDPALVDIVSRCLEKQPESRYPDLGAVRSALTAITRRAQLAQEEADNDVTMPVRIDRSEPPSGSTPPSSGSGRRDSASVEQMKVRAEQTRARRLVEHIDAGRRALEQGDHDGVFAACEQALVLDPTNQQALELEARARAVVDRQLQDRLKAARADLERGALTSASLLADQVLALNSESAEAKAIHQEIDSARSRLAREEEAKRERQRAFERALSEAKRHMAAGARD
jgi:serine/threonine protein kinase